MTYSGASQPSRQRLVGATSRRETRQRLLEAAAEEFEVVGYRVATVSRIAKRAGVTVQTLYLAWGSKRALLRGYLEATLRDGDHEPGDVLPRFVDPTAEAVVSELAALFVDTAERSSRGWQLYKEAAASDADIATDWAELQTLRRATFKRILESISPASDLRANIETATDTAWTIASPESYDLLVHQLNYAPDRYRDWLRTTLRSALLHPSTT